MHARSDADVIGTRFASLLATKHWYSTSGLALLSNVWSMVILLFFASAAQEANSQAVAGGMSSSPTANLHPYDPEHLIVNGLGGAFLHPTHVFAPARFASVPDPAADELFEQGHSPRGRSPKGGTPSGTSPRGTSPAGRSPRRGLSRRGSFTGQASLRGRYPNLDVFH